jgi:hypothetical protein
LLSRTSTDIMHRGEGEPYNPYPDERGSPRGEGPQYGSNLEHRPPPPPSRPDYGAPAPHGYGEGPYGQERRPGPYEEHRHGGYEEQRHGGYEEQRHGGFEERKNSSQYPPGPNPYGSSANPASGQMVARQILLLVLWLFCFARSWTGVRSC